RCSRSGTRDRRISSASSKRAATSRFSSSVNSRWNRASTSSTVASAILGNLRLPGPTRLTLRCSGLVGSLVSEVQQPRGFLLRDLEHDYPVRPQSNPRLLHPPIGVCRTRIGTSYHSSASPTLRALRGTPP